MATPAGRLSIKGVPASLRKKLIAKARRSGRSISGLVMDYIRQGMAAEQNTAQPAQEENQAV